MFHQLERRRLMSVTFDDGVLTVRGKACFDDEIEVSIGALLLGSYANVTLNGEVHATNPSGATEALPRKIVIQGGDGADDIVVSNAFWQGQVVIDGGVGDDTIRIGAVSATINGGDGDDIVDATNGDQSTISGDGGADRLRGSLGDDSLDGGAGDDTLDAGDGADTLVGGDGFDEFFGGAGDDLFRNLDLSGDEPIDGGDGTDRAQRNGTACGPPDDILNSIEEFDEPGGFLC